MWIRLKRLTISKNTHTGNMFARMKESTSSVNPLHPCMVEVQTIAIAYANACEAANAASAPPPPAINTSAQQEPRRGGNDEPTPGPAPSPASGPVPAPPPARESASDTDGRGSGDAQDSGLNGGGGSAPPERGRRGASSRSQVEEGASATRREQSPQSPGFRPRSQPERRGAGGDAGSGGEVGTENVSRRGTKRALPAGGAEGREEVAASPGCGALSNLGTVRRTVAPGVFYSRVKIVSHFPPKVRGRVGAAAIVSWCCEVCVSGIFWAGYY